MNKLSFRSYLSKDHARLDELFTKALQSSGQNQRKIYDQFRGGLLRHVGIEEKILFPELRKQKNEKAHALMDRLHLDHAALSVILVLSPSDLNLTRVRTLLDPHNKLEEESGGLYDLCDQLNTEMKTEMFEKMRSYPDVKLKPCSDNAYAIRLAHETYEAAIQGKLSFLRSVST